MVFAIKNFISFFHQAHTKSVVPRKPFYKGFLEIHGSFSCIGRFLRYGWRLMCVL